MNSRTTASVSINGSNVFENRSLMFVSFQPLLKCFFFFLSFYDCVLLFLHLNFSLIIIHISALSSKPTASWDYHSRRAAAERHGVHHLISTGKAHILSSLHSCYIGFSSVYFILEKVQSVALTTVGVGVWVFRAFTSIDLKNNNKKKKSTKRRRCV